MKRRHFLQTSLGTIAFFISRYAFTDTKKATRLHKTLSAYLDTLIPRDETPSVVDLGGLDHLVALSQKNKRWQLLLQLGAGWLDAHAKKRFDQLFAELDANAREQIVERASQGKRGSLEYTFFTRTKDVVFQYYYSQAETWPPLGYDGPPQPRGFLDYTSPPTRSSRT